MVVPTISTLEKVALALEVTIADLVLRDSPREVLFDLLRDATADEMGRLTRLFRSWREHRSPPVLNVAEPTIRKPSLR